MLRFTVASAAGAAQNAGMEQPRFADAARATRSMFIRDLVLDASIGVYPHEHVAPQRVGLTWTLAVSDDAAGTRLSRRGRGSG